jgi:uncharacterized repeat protein (TIGR03803 family)
LSAQGLDGFASIGVRSRFGFFLKIICLFCAGISHWLMAGESAHALEMNFSRNGTIMNDLKTSRNLAVRRRACCCLAVLMLNVLLPASAPAQTFTILHSFSATPNTNGDGVFPHGALTLSSNTLYGAAGAGGNSGSGIVFALNTDGTGFTNLHDFTAISVYPYTNNEGVDPNGELLLSGNTLYGTAQYGGNSGFGTAFSLHTDGTAFTNLQSFNGGSDGANRPDTGLVLTNNTLYGTTQYGGTSDHGVVFAVNTDGSGFTNLYSFTGFSDGASPIGGLILSGNTLYGAAYNGGSWGRGTVFAVNIDGSGFTNLHSFAAAHTNSSLHIYTNSEGFYPQSGLTLSGDTLYGTASAGGTSGKGTVFAVNIDGSGFTNLHNFIGRSDGANPVAGLILLGKAVYGTAQYGGSWGNGTVFAVSTDGTGFTTLHSFDDGGGANPVAGLILSGNTLYGTSLYGGSFSSGYGTVFSVSFTPQLSISQAGTNVVLSWPTNFAGFDYTAYTLGSTTNLGSSAIWDTNLPPPVVVNGQLTVTNPISGTQKFFRLSQ